MVDFSLTCIYDKSDKLIHYIIYTLNRNLILICLESYIGVKHLVSLIYDWVTIDICFAEFYIEIFTLIFIFAVFLLGNEKKNGGRMNSFVIRSSVKEPKSFCCVATGDLYLEAVRTISVANTRGTAILSMNFTLMKRGNEWPCPLVWLPIWKHN